MRYKRKQSKTEKNKVYFILHAGKHRVCTQKMQKSKYTQKIKQSYRILEYPEFCSGQVKCC